MKITLMKMGCSSTLKMTWENSKRNTDERLMRIVWIDRELQREGLWN